MKKTIENQIRCFEHQLRVVQNQRSWWIVVGLLVSMGQFSFGQTPTDLVNAASTFELPPMDFKNDTENTANKVLLAATLNAAYENAMNTQVSVQYELHKKLQKEINDAKLRIINKKIGVYNANRIPDSMIIKDPIIQKIKASKTRIETKLNELKSNPKNRSYRKFLKTVEKRIITDSLATKNIEVALLEGDYIPLLDPTQATFQWSDTLISKDLQHASMNLKERWNVLRQTRRELLAIEHQLENAETVINQQKEIKKQVIEEIKIDSIVGGLPAKIKKALADAEKVTDEETQEDN